jgi:hypothetical protein
VTGILLTEKGKKWQSGPWTHGETNGKNAEGLN